MIIKLLIVVFLVFPIHAMDVDPIAAQKLLQFPREVKGLVLGHIALLRCHQATSLEELYDLDGLIKCAELRLSNKHEFIKDLERAYNEKEYVLTFKNFKPTYPASEDPKCPLLMQVISHHSNPSPRLVNMLLKHGANANEQYRIKYVNSYKITPIILAIQEYHELSTGWIMKDGKAVPQPKRYANPQDDVLYEKKQKRLDIIRALVPVSDLALVDSSSTFNALEYAIIENLPIDILQTMLNLFPDDNFLETFKHISSLGLLQHLRNDELLKKQSFSVLLEARKKKIEELLYDTKHPFDSN